jgi:C1q domain
MKKIFLAWLLAIAQTTTPAYAGTQSIVKADIIEGLDTIKNYAGGKGHFEKNVSGWVGYDDGAAVPVDCSAGTFGGTIARTTTTPLSGDGSLLWTKGTTASVQGEGIALDFEIDEKDKGGVLKAVFDYLPSSVFSNDQVGVFVFDKDNPSNPPIQLSPYKIPHSLVATQIQPLEFQTVSNSNSYRLCLHVIGTDAANNWTLKLDGLKISKSVNGSGVFVSDWQSYTPTLTGATNGLAYTNSTTTGVWRRVGDQAEYRIKSQFTGLPATGTGLFKWSLPSGHVIDTNKLVKADTENYTDGISSYVDAGTGIFPGRVRYNDTASVTHSVSLANGTITQMNDVGQTPTSPATIASGDTITLNFKFPIVGWSSNMALSSAVNSSKMQANGYGNPSSVITASLTKVTWSSNPINQNFGGMWDAANSRLNISSGGEYTIIYCSEVSATWTAGTHALTTVIRYNGGSNIGHGLARAQVSALTTLFTCAEYIGTLNAGDYIEFHIAASGSGPAWSTANAGTSFFINKTGGHQQIAASETVAAHYKADAGQSIPNSSATTVIFEDKISDTHNAYNTTTGVFTAPLAGEYSFTASILYDGFAWLASSLVTCEYVHNSRVATVHYDFIEASIGARNLGRICTGKVRMNAGDTLRIRTFQNSGGARTIFANSDYNSFSIQRIGL